MASRRKRIKYTEQDYEDLLTTPTIKMLRDVANFVTVLLAASTLYSLGDIVAAFFIATAMGFWALIYLAVNEPTIFEIKRNEANNTTK